MLLGSYTGDHCHIDIIISVQQGSLPDEMSEDHGAFVHGT